MRGRAYRRYQLRRMRRRGFELFRWWVFYSTEDAKEMAQMYAITRHRCSAVCCGNPRKWFGEKTMQEREADEAFLLEESIYGN